MTQRGAAEPVFSIGQLAEAFGVTHRTIRFYEDEGLVSPTRRGTTRIYSATDRARLALILRGKRLGFSIAEIKEFLDLYDVDENQIEQMRYALDKARERLMQLNQQMLDLKQTRDELSEMIDQLETHLDQPSA